MFFKENAAARLSAWDDGSSEGENFAYDLRSNILSVTGRHPVGGVTPVETYTYSADKLATYTHSTTGPQSVSFVHDALGRMTSDGLSGLSITYNRLDLPENISRLDTLKAHIEYLPDGAKLSSTDSNGAGLLYRGPFVYRVGIGGASRALESVPFEGGVLTASGTLYHLTDHLGNVRAVVDKVGNVYSLNDYGVYGTLKSSPISVPGGLAPAPTGVSLRHTLTGKENLTPDFFVPFTDFGARHYRPSLRRWIVPDKLSEKYYDFTPYTYCGANPVNIVDEDGNRTWPIRKSYKGYDTRVHANNFGQQRKNHKHGGVDINYYGAGDDDIGAPIVATHSGKVTRLALYSDDQNGGGSRIRITSEDGKVSTFFMHLDEVANLKEGDYVCEGQQIGTMGGSGYGKRDYFPSHLHYEVFLNGERINPALDSTNLIDPEIDFLEPIQLFDEIEPAIIVDKKPTFQMDMLLITIEKWLH